MRTTLDALLGGDFSAQFFRMLSTVRQLSLQNVPAGLDPAPLQLEHLTDTWDVAMRRTARSDAHRVPCARSMKKFFRVFRLLASGFTGLWRALAMQGGGWEVLILGEGSRSLGSLGSV